jgi:hypothetical protein
VKRAKRDWALVRGYAYAEKNMPNDDCPGVADVDNARYHALADGYAAGYRAAQRAARKAKTRNTRSKK